MNIIAQVIEIFRELSGLPREVVVVPPDLMQGTVDVVGRFTYQKPSPEGVARHDTLAGWFIDIAEAVDRECPVGREKALALTKLEEAKMWASAAVARNPATR